MVRISEKKVQQYELEHEAAVRKAAAECALFLKRDESFPLSEGERIALYGNGARRTVKGGTGSGDVNVRHFVTIEEGLKRAGAVITTGEWLDAYDGVVAEAGKVFAEQIRREAKKAKKPMMIYGMGKIMPEPEYELPLSAEGAAAVYVLSRNSGEGTDRTVEAGDIGLTASEKRDILRLNAMFDRFLLVLNVGGLIDLSPVEEVKNILLLGQLGMAVGDAFADILFGKANPSGKLAMTWADIDSYPSTEGFGDWNDTCYREGIFVGYRYFDREKLAVAYPFGFGRSYTDFSVRAGEVVCEKEAVTVSSTVKNIGRHPGKEVVQLYVSDALAKERDRPYQELRGFQKTGELLPGEEEEIRITVSRRELAVYDEKEAAFIVRKGEYLFRIGNSSKDTAEAGRITIDEDIFIQKTVNICEKNGGRTAEITEEKVPAAELSGQDKKLLASLSDRELAWLCIGHYVEREDEKSIVGNASMKVAGAAGETTNRLTQKGIDSVVMADGPAGVRLSPAYRIIGDRVKGCGIAFGAEMLPFLDEEEQKKLKGEDLTEEEKKAEIYYQNCTAIPIGTDIAQSWNPELAERLGDIVGDEMERFGIGLWLAPALNIQRSPLCGRNFEYYSEDPLVSGKIAAAITRGVQRHPGCGVTIKHFAANNQETNRYASNSVLTEQALREIYLKGFEICIRESAPATVMTSYNLINGLHTANSRELLTQVLRNEWGFEGVVMTDWLVTTDIMLGAGSKYPPASAAGCIKAGNDIIMPGTPQDLEDILDALKREDHPYHLTREDLLACAARVLGLTRKYA